jgi:phage FluMu protein Com
MKEIRCKHCGKLLCKIGNQLETHGCKVKIQDDILKQFKEKYGEIVQPKIEIKCPRCKEINTVNAERSVKE